MKRFYVLFLIIFPVWVFALEYPELDSDKVIVYDITDDNVLYAVKEQDKASIASLTKIMTTITAIQKISDLDKEVVITKEMLSTVRWDASVAGLKENDKVTYRDLLYASILPSGADATNSLAILLSGDIDSFVKDMNDLKDEIGLNNTHFVNTTGLDIEGHYSTAEDIIKLLKYAFKNELFKTIYTTRKYELSNGMTVFSTITKYYGNSSLDKIIGSKTGFTLDAGRCISVYFKSNGHEMFLVTLGASTDKKNSNVLDALSLINFVEANYEDRVLISDELKIKDLEVEDSKIDNLSLYSTMNFVKYLPSDYDKDKVRIVYEGKDTLSFRDKFGSKVGHVKYYFGDELLGEEDFYLDEEIKMDLGKIIYKYRFYLGGFLLFVILIFIFIKMKKKSTEN